MGTDACRLEAPREQAGSRCLAEAVDGAIITALNEEAVIGAALGNKGGINLAVSYEAFAVKMLGALRQEIIFARHQKEAGSHTGLDRRSAARHFPHLGKRQERAVASGSDNRRGPARRDVRRIARACFRSMPIPQSRHCAASIRRTARSVVWSSPSERSRTCSMARRPSEVSNKVQ